MSIIRVLILAFMVLGLQSVGPWTVQKKEIKNGEGLVTGLEFTKGRQKRIYVPSKKSLWVLSIKNVELGKQLYFVTAWSYGGRSLLFRVFDPNIKNEPLCEVISYGEKAPLRIKNKVLQIKVFEDSSEKASGKSHWKDCRKFS